MPSKYFGCAFFSGETSVFAVAGVPPSVAAAGIVGTVDSFSPLGESLGRSGLVSAFSAGFFSSFFAPDAFLLTVVGPLAARAKTGAQSAEITRRSRILRPRNVPRTDGIREDPVAVRCRSRRL